MEEKEIGALKRIIEEVEEKRKAECLMKDCIINEMIGGDDIQIVKSWLEKEQVKPKLKITLSEEDCNNIRYGDVMEWSWTAENGLEVDLVLGLGVCCDSCCEEVLKGEIIEGENEELCKDCKLKQK